LVVVGDVVSAVKMEAACPFKNIVTTEVTLKTTVYIFMP
jgi:hypothetical protein